MQLTGPLFLFVFFPLSLLFLPFCPPKYRKLTLTLLSVLWYVLANLSTPAALLQIFAVVALCALLAALPDGEYSKLRCAAGVILPLVFFVTARLLAEYGPASYPYPMGLTFVTLGAVSMSIDRYRGDAPDRDSPLSVVGYLLFFPTLSMGPILRYKQYLYVTEHISPDVEHFSAGARLYMLGFIKRIAVAAVILRALEELLSFGTEIFALPALLMALLLAFFLLYFFVSGNTDMARGLMTIYGMQPPRGQARVFSAATPSRMLYGIFLSLDRYLEDYVALPLARRWGSRWGKLLGTLFVFAFSVLFYRFRPELLLIALPLLLWALLTSRYGRFRHFPKNAVLHALCTLASAFFLSVFALGVVLEEPLDVFPIFRAAFTSRASYSFFHIYSAISDLPYLLFMGILLSVVLLVQHVWPALCRRMPKRARIATDAALTLLLMLGFVVTLVHFMPQFPQYADSISRKLFL